MLTRRNFLKTAALAAVGSGLAIDKLFAVSKVYPLTGNMNRNLQDKMQIAGKEAPALFNINKSGLNVGRLQMTFFPYELKLRHVFTVATNSRTTTPDVQVEITCDGITGYGEASMPPYLGESTESVMTFLRKVDLSPFNDPFQLEDILTYIDSLSVGDTAAKAAVDIALHDLVGKMLGAPWYKIWGFDPAKAPSTTFTIGIDTPDVVRQKTLECADRFNILKVKVGRDNDKEMISTIRSVTNLPIAVDANQGWTDKHYALDMIHWLKEQGVVMVEQPMSKTRPDDNAWITAHSPLPIFADESLQRLKDILPLKDAYTGINIKLMKCTGMREAHKMFTMARALGMKVMLGCMTETSCAVSAAAQLSPVVDFADLDGNLLISNDRFRGMEVVKGRITLPDRPGIGVVKL
ncbi:MAG: twin-arginine translocation signal domain-containing protein [Prevotellaceae bacterium]|jgi:L-alanine-DL-glutamate epimerase-like enolase superfamily enzyme|nr:twin-arginine translocation signal domain-containing protein [Prevotellaceae bacterium]